MSILSVYTNQQYYQVMACHLSVPIIEPVKYDAPLTPDDDILFSVASIVSLTCWNVTRQPQQQIIINNHKLQGRSQHASDWYTGVASALACCLKLLAQTVRLTVVKQIQPHKACICMLQ
jgi:hypothetical protein